MSNVSELLVVVPPDSLSALGQEERGDEGWLAATHQGVPCSLIQSNRNLNRWSSSRLSDKEVSVGCSPSTHAKDIQYLRSF